MKPKILLNEDIQLQLALSLRRRGFDAVHVQEINRKGKTAVIFSFIELFLN